MDLKLENKHVLVTGSTGGIGAGIAQRFAEEGATVVINGRRADAAGTGGPSHRADRSARCRLEPADKASHGG